jgi:pre-mRNA-processing factor 40
MNGMNGGPVAPPVWQEAKNADGRVYYYNTITRATQWTKPEELMTAAEVCVILPNTSRHY